jgi:hypothetical protein
VSLFHNFRDESSSIPVEVKNDLLESKDVKDITGAGEMTEDVDWVKKEQEDEQDEHEYEQENVQDND